MADRPDDRQGDAPAPASGHRVATNVIVLLILRIAVPMLSLALVLVISRTLGAEGLGRYTLVFSFLNLLGGLGPLGLPTVITREGARERSRLSVYLNNGILLGAVASAVLTVAMIAAGYAMGYDAATNRGLLILSVGIFPYTLGMFLDSAIVAVERMSFMAIATTAEFVIKVAFGLALLYLGYGLDSVLVMAVLGRVAGCLVSIRLLRREGVVVGSGFDRAVLGMLARQAPTFLSTMIFATLYWRIDILMLSKLASVEDLGYYGAAYRMFDLAAVFPQSICLSLYPQVVAAMHSDPRRLDAIGRLAVRYMSVVTLPAAVFMTLVPTQVLELLYGNKFDAAAPTLSILIWTLIPYTLVRYHAYVLVAAGRQRIDLLLNVFMSVVNVLLNLVLIPRYSHIGAALATLASICLLGTIQYVYVRTRLPGHGAAIGVPPVLVAATAIGAGCCWATSGAHVLVSLGCGGVAYALTLLVGRFFTEDELRYLRVHGVLHRLRQAGSGAR